MFVDQFPVGVSWVCAICGIPVEGDSSYAYTLPRRSILIQQNPNAKDLTQVMYPASRYWSPDCKSVYCGPICASRGASDVTVAV